MFSIRHFMLFAVLLLGLSQWTAAQSAPLNDHWANRETVSLSYTDTETGIFLATNEAADPVFSCKSNAAGYNSVWYSYTASGSEQITINTFSSNYDTLLAVYTGTPGAFTQVACNDNASSTQQSSVTFLTAAGENYSIIVSSAYLLGGGETLHLNIAGNASPINDNIAQASPFTMPFDISVNNVFATLEDADPVPACLPANSTIFGSLWYTYTSTSYETVTLSFTANTFTPVLAVYMGAPEALYPYGCADNTTLVFQTQPATTFYILLAGVGTSAGSLMLNGVSSPQTHYNFTVNTTADTRDLTLANQACLDGFGNCSLRAAIMEANSLAPAASTITLPAGSYTLTLPGVNEDNTWSGDLDIKTSITIIGADNATTTINGNQLDRVFHILNGMTQLVNVTITGGNTTLGGGIYNIGTLSIKNAALLQNIAETSGGAIYNSEGVLIIQSSVVDNNQAVHNGAGISSSYGALLIIDTKIRNNILAGQDPSPDIMANGGAGIFTDSPFTVLRSHISDNNSHFPGGGMAITAKGKIIKTTITHNTGQAGGGIASRWFETNLEIEQSTISENTATFYGGGIFIVDSVNHIENSTISGNAAPTSGSGIENSGELSLNNVTITGNSGHSGLYYDNSDWEMSLQVANSIIAENEPSDCVLRETITISTFTSLGNNLVGDFTNCTVFDEPGDMVNANPLLAPLQDNGGLTWTHMPSALSPAIDAGNNATCAATDQRGVSRPQGASCDIGAVEYDGTLPQPTATFTPAPSTSTFTPVPPTSTFTSVPATLTFTPQPNTATATALQPTFTPDVPTVTFTPVESTVTFTPDVPTATPTPVESTATFTALPETIMPTFTVEPPTATPEQATPTAIPDTATPLPPTFTPDAPTPTIEPVLEIELLANTGFEEGEGNGSVQPAGWKVVHPSRDKRVCGNPNRPAYEGDCAFLFTGQLESVSFIQQNLMGLDAYDIGEGDQLILSGYFRGTVESGSILAVLVYYDDGTRKRLAVPLNDLSGEFYIRYERVFVIPAGKAVERTKLKVVMKSSNKWFLSDNVSLILGYADARRMR